MKWKPCSFVSHLKRDQSIEHPVPFCCRNGPQQLAICAFKLSHVEQTFLTSPQLVSTRDTWETRKANPLEPVTQVIHTRCVSPALHVLSDRYLAALSLFTYHQDCQQPVVWISITLFVYPWNSVLISPEQTAKARHCERCQANAAHLGHWFFIVYFVLWQSGQVAKALLFVSSRPD